ncbi:hypothetical protein BCR41DRAFT_147789 [Lobosporangium transversale]|uniref:Glycosyltransferase 61 catalytic domain-containing protein n=1 Tax=Lobosporangium transversale TaxID=64571 RepID=A0A1Y2GE43_9FUNG|nr:hypothetical protein BCR41DRAFT_147789 [Lobosporangium transversale]ORZ08285.1 hypothetical protein BCR41DRAFT_147789 [Lobosporangium transversale]|eukprot:XP_021878368.1 hypothetical protein BCR41DRAFT_147789 [Lobosporangium transversale]
MDHFFYTGKEIVLHLEEVATAFQTLPPSDAPICFKRAVIGLGSQCALSYCENNIPAEVYKAFRDEIADHYWGTPGRWDSHLALHRVTEDNSLQCLDLARYYNFDGVGQDYSQERDEKSKQIDQLHPDVVNSEQGSKNITTGASSESHERKLVVGIIQREGSRRLINDEAFIQALVKAGFRVKWMTFDHGCGIAETAYLLRDVQVLVSPHGNAIGTSLFMPTSDPIPTIISADSTRYAESWFKFTTTVLAQRFMSAVCGPSNYPDEVTKAQCPHVRDSDLAERYLKHSQLVLGLPPSMVKSDKEKKSMSQGQIGKMIQSHRAYVKSHPEAKALAEKEFEELLGPEASTTLYNKYGESTFGFWELYWKAMPRYLDVPRLVQFIENRQNDWMRERQEAAAGGRQPSDDMAAYRSFMEYVRKGQICRIGGWNDCAEIQQRNIAGPLTAYGRHSIDNIAQWGEPTSESQSLLQGVETYKDWPFAATS